MTVDPWTFPAAMLDAANGRLEFLIALLRADHPLTATDKNLLADHLSGKFKRGRGRRPEPMYSPTWYLQQAVKEVKELQLQKGMKRAEAIEWVCFGSRTKHRDLVEHPYKDMSQRRDEIENALDRSEKPRSTKGRAK